MKYLLIYYLDHKNNDQVTIKDYYTSKDDAINSLEKVALEFIKEQQGKQQINICRQYEKSVDDILKDTNIKEGLYIKKQGDIIVLYEKKNIIIPGTIWNSFDIKIDKIGMFNITEVNMDLANKCTCNLSKQTITTKQSNKIVYTFLDEFKNLLSTDSIKLKSILKKD